MFLDSYRYQMMSTHKYDSLNETMVTTQRKWTLNISIL